MTDNPTGCYAIRVHDGSNAYLWMSGGTTWGFSTQDKAARKATQLQMDDGNGRRYRVVPLPEHANHAPIW